MFSKLVKNIALAAFSLFYIGAVGLHIYKPIVGSTTPIWWHLLYIITYGTCWRMLFSENNKRLEIFSISAIFPFVAHLYIGYQNFTALNGLFYICILVCIVTILGFIFIQKLNKNL